MIESLRLRPLELEASQISEVDMTEAITLSYLQGRWDEKLGIDDDDVLVPQGELRDHPLRVTRDTWLYAIRYLLGGRMPNWVHTVHDAVLTEVINQIRQEIREQNLGDHSIVLIGHSFGSVVALDILQNADLKPHLARFVSVGSPLSAIAAIPGIQKLLPLAVRACPVPWIDIAAENDWLVYPPYPSGPPPRLSERKDFSGGGKPVIGITLPPIQGDPHSDYFEVESVRQQWIEHLM
jgi:pimeloyl-ACP methyl ester carboxylesterase